VRFDTNQKEFPITTHKSIWHAAVFMAPFREVIPTQVTGRETDNLQEGEKNLYQFMTDLYSDMYDNPEAYYLPADEYDNFMKSREGKNLTDKDKLKESLLRNKFQRAIQFYQKLVLSRG
jgi:hypothetical protein